MRITFFNTCRVGSQVQMDQQGEITGKPGVLWFSPDANWPRIQPTVVLWSLHRGGSIPHPACSGNENSSCQEFCIKSSPILAHGPGILSSRARQAVTGLQIVFSSAPALHSSVQNIRHNWRFIEVLGFVWSHSSFPNYHLGLKYWWLCIARGFFCCWLKCRKSGAMGGIGVKDWGFLLPELK